MTNRPTSDPEPDDPSRTINTHPMRQAAGAMTPPVWLTLILILAGAGVLRFTGLDKEGRWGDEYRQTRVYQLSPSSVVLEARSAGQPPLDYLIGWALARVKQSDRMRRIPAAVWGVAGIAGLFLLVRWLDSPQTGLLAAALLALSPLHWALSQEARPYTIATTAMILTMWALARALEHPSARRLWAFGVICYAFTLTRGLLPLVVVCAIEAVLSALWLFRRFSHELRERIPAGVGARRDSRTSGFRTSRQPADALVGRAVTRVWLVTLIVAVATVPLVLYLLFGEAFTVFSEAGRRTGEALGVPLGTRLASNAAGWARLAPAMFGASFPLVIGLAAVGVWRCIQRRAALSPGVGSVLAVMVVVGPLYLLAFSISVPVAPIRMRYGLFLAPILALFAAMALVDVLRWLRHAAGNQAVGRIGAALAMLVILGGPAAKTLALSEKYFRPDWRGCAAYLADRVEGEDVVMVYEDRPVHEPRMTFWGKYDWPSDMEKPLAEPIRSLALSESHWNRLCRKTGRCFIVIRYQVGTETKDEYLSRGLQEVPPHLVLRKFRGLDLLERPAGSDDPIDRMIDACDDLLALPKQHQDANAFLYALRSRLQLRAGDPSAAVESFEQAGRVVPGKLRSWFVEQLAVHAAALSRAAMVADSLKLAPFENPVAPHNASH